MWRLTAAVLERSSEQRLADDPGVHSQVRWNRTSDDIIVKMAFREWNCFIAILSIVL